MKRPKAVCISDIHFNINTLPIASAALRMALKKAWELKVPLIIAGDLLDQKCIIRGEVANELLKIFASKMVPIFVIPGNHCKLSEKSDEHSLHFLEHHCILFNGPGHWAPLDMWFIPYQNDSGILEHEFLQIPSGATIIAHQGVQGADMGHYVMDKTSAPKEWFAKFRTISGHYHKAQDIQCGPSKSGNVGIFSYIGSPYTTSFSEANDGPKGFRILYSDGSLELVPTNLRKHIVVQRGLEDLLEPIKEYTPGDLVWLKVKGPYSELAKIKKNEVGQKLFGHNNFKLEKISTDVQKLDTKNQGLADENILDMLIDGSDEGKEQKDYLKSLWREICATR